MDRMPSGRLESVQKQARDPRQDNLQLALAILTELTLDGIRHGFFELGLTCEVVHGRKRRLVIRAGKSHQFTIAEEEL